MIERVIVTIVKGTLDDRHKSVIKKDENVRSPIPNKLDFGRYYRTDR
ncbi:hypothetical protein [Chamaesiphon minutus]|nr:hypothetical protein [Chamaesiphon minutus]